VTVHLLVPYTEGGLVNRLRGLASDVRVNNTPTA